MPNTTPELSETLDKFIGIALRRRWWFLIAASVVAIGAVVVSFFLPNRFKSEATILVQQQQVPERYVVPNSTTNLDQALEAMTQDVLSRTRLLQIVSDFGLYPEQKKRLSAEQLVDLMRTDIEIEPLESKNMDPTKGPNAFKISYIGRSPDAAEQVTSRLTSLFINEDLKTQQQRDVSTTNFLQSQLITAQADLDKKEQRLRDFKMANLGELPEQQQGNLQILDGLQMQLQNTNSALARANEQHAYLESLLGQYRNLTVATGASPGAVASPIEIAQAQLAHLRSERATLLGSYSPEYPDVKKIDSEIVENEALLARLEKSTSTAQRADASSSTAPSTSVTTDNTIAQLNSQLKQNQLEITNDTAQIKQIQTQVEEYQHRLNLTPVREQQLTDILRGYDLAKKNYDDLYSKKTQSALATDLQIDQQGEQFRLIDPPNLPTKPFTPNRLKIALGGIAAGLALGAGLAFLMEMKDASLHSEKELRARFVLPIVMGVPLFVSKREKRMRSIKAVMQWCAGTILVLAVLAAEYYVYRRG